MILSFLIPTKNRPKDLEANINAINELDLIGIDYEILVLDDGSEIDYINVISKYNYIKYYKNESTMGISQVRNKLARHAKGKYLIFLDDDVTVDKNLNVRSLFEFFESDRKLGLIAFNITAFLDSNTVYGKINSSEQNLSKETIKQIPFKKYQLYFTPDLYETINYVTYFIGAAFACKKSVFNNKIEFDELFFWGNEELDFSYNLIKNDYSLIYHPEFKANHFPKKSVINANTQKINSFNLFISNRILTAYKSLPLLNALTYITVWMTYYFFLSLLKFRFYDWILGIKMGIKKTNYSNRNSMSKDNMIYLKKNFGRIYF